MGDQIPKKAEYVHCKKECIKRIKNREQTSSQQGEKSIFLVQYLFAVLNV